MNKKILIVALPEKGHINPIIGVAQCLSKMNIEIGFFSQIDISKQLSKANLNCKHFTPKKNFDIPEEFAVDGKRFAEKLKDKLWMQKWIKTLLIDSTPPLVHEIKNVVNAFKPDIIVSDPMVYAAAIVAENSKIPWAGISNSLNPLTPKEWNSDLIETLNKFKTERLALFSSIKRNLNFRVADLISPWLNTVFTTETYIPRKFGENNNSFYVGKPFLLNEKRGDETPFPFEKLQNDKKKVYMSLGSMVYYHPVLFETIARALEGLNVQFIASVGSLYSEGFAKKFSNNSIILPYVPQLKLLKHIDVMVSHGGANSVTECLSMGVPLALLPLCNDQFFQAKFLKNAKAGIILDANNPDVATYKNAVIKLIEKDNVYKKNAQLIKKSFDNYGGPEQVSSLICKLLETKQQINPILS